MSGAFGNFMTLTMYVFGLGMAIYVLRNPSGLVSAVSGVWNSGVNVVSGIGKL